MIYRFLLILSMGVFAFSGHAKANNHKVIRYGDFVTFSPEQQINAIKLVHEFLSEYDKNVAKYQPKNSKLKKKYQTYLKIMNYFIASAYASDEITSMIQNNPALKGTMCYYAGWLSYTYDYNGKKLCVSPTVLEGFTKKNNIFKNEQEKKFYSKLVANYNAANKTVLKMTFKDGEFKLTPSSNGCSGDHIICNPKLYGDVDGKPFCVPGNNQSGVNSSLMCAQAAETVKNDTAQFGTQAYDDLMLKIATNAKNDGPNGDFFYTLKAMYETCLCAGDKSSIPSEIVIENQKNQVEPTQNLIDFNYANRIFYTRTCYGIIQQTENIYEAMQSNLKLMCEDSDVLNQYVNGPNSLSYSWGVFLNKLNTHIQGQKIKEEIKEQLDNLKLGKRIISGDEARADDKNLFRQKREEHFKQNLAENMCPVGFDKDDPGNEDDEEEEEVEKTSFEITCLENCKGPNPAAKVRVEVKYNDSQKPTEVSITTKIEDGDELKEVKEDPEDIFKNDYEVTRGKDSVTVVAKVVVDGEDLGEEKYELDPIEEDGPKLQLEVLDAEGEKAKTHQYVDVTIKIPEGEGSEDKPDATAVNKTLLSVELKPLTEGKEFEKSEGVLIGESESKVRFTVTRQEDSFDVKASVDYNQKPLESNKGTIVGTKGGSDEKDPEVEAKDCSIELSVAEAKDGNDVKMSYTYEGETYSPDSKEAQPEGVEVSIKWYDSVKTETVAPVESETEQEMISEDEAKTKQDDESSDSDEESEEIADIKKNLSPATVHDNRLTMGAGPASTQTRTIAAILTISKDGKQVCQASDQTEIPGVEANNNSGLKNDNPAFKQPSPGRAQKQRGMSLKGTQ